MQRQKIRPSYADLQRLGDDDDDEEGGENGSGDDVLEYAPAATPYRGVPPPVIGATGHTSSMMATGKPAKVVRIASSRYSSSDPGLTSKSALRDAQSERRPTPQRVRIADDGSDKPDRTLSEGNDGPSAAPLIGTIHERSGVSTASNAAPKKVSRFASARSKEASTEFTSSASKPAAGTSDQVEEVWLDEDGQPMSAFRRARLASQGKAPPSKANAKGAPLEHPPRISHDANLETTSPMSALMAGISAQNDAKLSGMSIEEVEESLQELQRTFGEATLQKLKMRRAGQKSVAESTAKDIASVEQKELSKERAKKGTQEEQSPEQIRAKYFPNEAIELPASLKWTQEPAQEAETEIGALRFDFSGKVIVQEESQVTETRLAGLHHHGDRQDKAGYTTTELLHLARSTLPSQSIVALQTLERIVSMYVEVLLGKDVSTRTSDVLLALRLAEENVRGKAALISSWYIEDRQISLRASALRCLRACLSTTLVGPHPVPCVVTGARRQDKKGDTVSDPSISILSEDFALALIPSIGNLMSQHGLPASEMETCLEIIAFLSKRSTKSSSALLRHRGCLSSIGRFLSAPSASSNGEGERNALSTILCLVSSSRSNATSLVEQGYIDALLRFMAIPPWQMDDEKYRKDAWTHLDLVMQIYAALAKYGLYSDLPAKAYTVLPPLLDWIAGDGSSSEKRSEEELRALASTIRCLEGWVVCAIDPHQTHGHHDIGWSQVSDWWECACKCAQHLMSGDGVADTVVSVEAASEAIALLDRWTECAEKYAKLDESQRQEIQHIDPLVSRLANNLRINITKNVEQLLTASRSQWKTSPFWRSCLPIVKQLAGLCRAASKVVTAARKRCLRHPLQSLVKAADTLTSGKMWSMFQSEDARLAGSDRPRMDISFFCCDARLAQDGEDVKACDAMRLLAILGPGQEEMSLHLINRVLPTALPALSSSDLHVIRPFTNELVRPKRRRVAECPQEVTSESLRKTQTLFRDVFEEETNQEEDDSTDPLSGATLWKSASSGLPLRADWPIAALDDLLHSGTCASLNRKDALGNDWDFNEVQIVTSALTVAAQLYEEVLTAGDASEKDVLPSTAEVHLAIMKVFMLEEVVQSQDSKGSGLITGKDLFRNSKIVSLLQRLFLIGKQRHRGCGQEEGEDNMEKAMERQNGTSLPFYQFYTSFFGLYDSISFGMELFGRALLLAQTKEYADDYRRLLWLDYSHCLGTIGTTVQLDPQGNNLAAYLVISTEEKTNDDTSMAILEAMMNALHSKVITMERNELIWNIAIQQIGFSLWYDSQLSEKARKTLARMLHASSNKEEEDGENLVYSTILHLKVQSIAQPTKGLEDVVQRRRWLKEALQVGDPPS